MSPSRRAVFLGLLLSLLRGGACTKTAAHARAPVKPNPVKFLLVSAPREGRVSYMRVRHVSLQGSGSASEPTGEVEDLITHGLVHPQGLAVDQEKQLLLVADPGQKKIFSFPLTANDGALTVGPMHMVAEGPEARWVATDAMGNVFFSDEPKNQILRIPHSQVLRGNKSGAGTPEVVFDGTTLSQVSAPGGVAVDGFHTYWVNKQVGTQVGSIFRASEGEAGALASRAAPQLLARNTDKSYGVCLAMNNVFFTQPDTTIFGVKKTGGSVVPVSERLKNPRGCVWDGDGTVYVADRGANAVFSFAGNMLDLGEAKLTRIAAAQDAFGVAIFAGAPQHMPSVAVLGILLLALVRP